MDLRLTPEKVGTIPWHSVENVEAVFSILGVNERGLSTAEAKRRLQGYGLNEITPPEPEPFHKKLFRHINNILIYILIVAALFSVYFAISDYEGDGGFTSWLEFWLILGVIVINVSIGLIQEGKAQKAADAIKAMLSPQALVLRDGNKVDIEASLLVPGDIIYLKSGDKVPADVRVVEVSKLQVQEAMLTGESVPIGKSIASVDAHSALGDRKCMAYSGTNVSGGEGVAVVCETGDNAEIGRISKLVMETESLETNLQQQLHIIGTVLAICVCFLGVLAFVLGWQGPFEMKWQTSFKNAVATAVAIIPEGLPAVVTVTLALGVSAMAKQNAIIRQLPCVETLGSLTVICSDKTGTLTKNEMTAVSLLSYESQIEITGVGYAPTGKFLVEGGGGEKMDLEGDEKRMRFVRNLLEVGTLCNNASIFETEAESTGAKIWASSGNPTEAAILVAAMKAGMDPKGMREERERLATIPFESEHKFMATVVNKREKEGGGRVILVKGAADKLGKLCRYQVVGDDMNQRSDLDGQYWAQKAADLSSLGLRVLALCVADVDEDEDLEELDVGYVLKRENFLTMVGLVAILDPPREECIDSIAEAHGAGIVVKMITGDHAQTALAIGYMLGIAHENGVVYTGPQLDDMSPEQLQTVVTECNIFARASPENKIQIVQALQEVGEVSSMTGDGVNDAPALKAANIGVAMGVTGTDVSKEASQMVLADDNFSTILAAVREGRRVWDNLRKILTFNLPCNFAQGMSVFLPLFLTELEDIPLTVIQVLYVNMITAVTMGLMLACEPAEKKIMKKPPRKPKKRLLGRFVVWRIFIVSIYMAFAVIWTFWGREEDIEEGQVGYSLPERRGEAFTLLILMEVMYSLNCRFLKTTAFTKKNLFGNKWAYVSIFIVIFLQFLILHVPPLNTDVFKVAPLSAIQWFRIFLISLGLFLFVEFEKSILHVYIFPLVARGLGHLGFEATKKSNVGCRDMKGAKTLSPYTPSFALLPGLGGGKGGRGGGEERQEQRKSCTLDLWNLEGVKQVEEVEVEMGVMGMGGGSGSGSGNGRRGEEEFEGFVEEEVEMSVPSVVVDDDIHLFED